MAYEDTAQTASPDEGVVADTTAVDPEMDSASAKKWKARIDAARKERNLRSDDWRTNVDYRRGKVFAEEADQDRIAVNKDWAITKAKQALLFSQVPAVRLTAKIVGALGTVVPVFAKMLNDGLPKSGIGETMDECVPDAINAAGAGAAIVRCEKKTANVKMPKMARGMVPGLSDEEWQIAIDNELIEMVEVPKILDRRFVVERVSPASLLWPKTFKGSNFNKGPWIGRDGETTWADAASRFGLTEEQRSLVVGQANDYDSSGYQTSLAHKSGASNPDDDVVRFAELYYWRHLYHPEETCYDAIQHVVFVDGLDEPSIFEPWSGQKKTQDGKYVGACLFPIQVLTLTYLSDEAIPPSDSAIIRPQIDELIESRTQMMLQRRHSQPMRWVNVTVVDPLIMEAIQKGTYQGFIPVDGDGDRAIGEVARANYPVENHRFDDVVRRDIQEATQVGDNQNAAVSSGETSATEAEIVQSNFQTQIGYARARTSRFFLNLVEVYAGLRAIHDEFELPELSPEDAQRYAAWDRTQIANEALYDIRKDSTVLLDADQEIKRIKRFLSDTVQSGYVDPEPALRRYAELSGLDPDTTIRKPQLQEPEKPKIAFSFKGEDMGSAVVVATMVAQGVAPMPEHITIAKEMILSAEGMVPSADPAATSGPPSAPPDGPKTDQSEAFPDWHGAPRIDTRRGVGEEQ